MHLLIDARFNLTTPRRVVGQELSSGEANVNPG